MIFLTSGTGLGAGLILDGKLYAGTSDMAGECGQMKDLRMPKLCLKYLPEKRAFTSCVHGESDSERVSGSGE